MNCSNCGTEIPSDERFCRNCGREVEWAAPTIYAGASTPAKSGGQATESFNHQLKTESINPPAQTTPEWPVPPVLRPPVTSPTPDRRSFLVPITVASIVIALFSIGALAYFVMSKEKAKEGGTIPPERPQQTASPSASTTTATPSPTVQTTPTATPTATPKPTPNNEPPPGARLGYCNDTNVFVRSAPDLNAKPVAKVGRGQNLWVIGSSSNYSTWKGITSNWTQVQVYNSSLRGWVFTPFISYQ